MTVAFEYYELKNADKGVSKGFNCKSVPRITLRSIAQNPTLDPIFAVHAPLLETTLASLKQALGDVGRDVRQKLAAKLAAKQKAEGKTRRH